MEPHWPSVWAVSAILTGVAVVHLVVKAVVDDWLIRRTVTSETRKLLDAVSKRLDASEIYLTAAEQHTALLGDWEERRKQEHERRNQENLRMIRQLIQIEMDKRLKKVTDTVVGEVQQVPDKVMERVTVSDSQHGDGLRVMPKQSP